MGKEGWRKLEERDDKALRRDDQDLGHAVSRVSALDSQGKDWKDSGFVVCHTLREGLIKTRKTEKRRYASHHHTSTTLRISARACLGEMRIIACMVRSIEGLDRKWQGKTPRSYILKARERAT